MDSQSVMLNQHGDVHNDMVYVKLSDIPRLIEILQDKLKEPNASTN